MADSSSESDTSSPVVKAKYAGAEKNKSKFNKGWIVKYPFISSVSTDKSALLSKLCHVPIKEKEILSAILLAMGTLHWKRNRQNNWRSQPFLDSQTPTSKRK